MQSEKKQRSQFQSRSLGCLGGQEHVWQGFLSCCKTHNRVYYIQGWNNNGQEPPFDRKLIYPPDMAHLVITGERTSLTARLKKKDFYCIYSSLYQSDRSLGLMTY